MFRDHPRACGENRCAWRPADFLKGSPPRVRGKPQAAKRDIMQRRITPARAGKTLNRKSMAPRPADHPRACGENFCSGSQNYRLFGSPPRVRGKRAARSGERAGVGITPARAGKTLEIPLLPCRTGDHPRACGENQSRFCARATIRGSPPRVRGKPAITPTDLQGVRITPARAGKTWRTRCAVHRRRDHPRACGENGLHSAQQAPDSGSPPRVRGKPHQVGDESIHRRITPARAGKTQRLRKRSRAGWDHPRACGENMTRAASR